MKLPFVPKREAPVTEPYDNPFRPERVEPALRVDTPAADVGGNSLEWSERSKTPRTRPAETQNSCRDEGRW